MYALTASYFTERYTCIDTVYDSVFVGCLKYNTSLMALLLPFHQWLGMCIRSWLHYICTSLIIGKLAYYIKEQRRDRQWKCGIVRWRVATILLRDLSGLSYRCQISMTASKKAVMWVTLTAAPMWWMELDSLVKCVTFVFCWLLVGVPWCEVNEVMSRCWITRGFITWRLRFWSSSAGPTHIGHFFRKFCPVSHCADTWATKEWICYNSWSVICSKKKQAYKVY